MACSSCGKLSKGEVGFTLQTACFCGSSSFTSVEEAQGGLIGALGPCVDSIRDIKTQLGARQYEVRLIHTKWTGGKRGSGEEYVYNEALLQPTPKLTSMAGVSKQSTEVGLAEAGSVNIEEISSTLDEATLLGLLEGRLPEADTNFYWEVRSPPRAGTQDIRRRFFPSGAPSFDATRFMWTIALTRAHGERTPGGLPRGEPTGVVH